MSPRTQSFLSLALGSGAALGTLSAAYGLVCPARGQGSKLPVVQALVAGVLLTCCALGLALAARRHADQEPERFFAQLALIVSGFFLCVVVLGFGIPCLFLEVHD